MIYQVPEYLKKELYIHDEDEYRDGATIAEWLKSEYYRGYTDGYEFCREDK